VLFWIVIVVRFMRPALGQLIGAMASGGVVAVVAWFIAGSIGRPLLAGGIALLFVIYAETLVSSSRARHVRFSWGGGRSSGGWSSGASGS
jgi:uncharacterized protein